MSSEEVDTNVDNDNTALKKRERTDENVSESSKKTKHSSIIPTTNGGSFLTEILEIPPDKVGSIIGSKGAIIQELQSRSGCKIFVNQEFPPGVNREVTFSGSPQQIKAGRELVELILNEGPTAIHALDGPVGNLIFSFNLKLNIKKY